MTTVQYEKVSLRQLRKRLDVESREKLNISGDDFIKRCRDRTLDMTSPVVSRLALLARLITEATPDKTK